MIRYLVILLIPCLLPSCVIISHDSRVAQMKPAKVPLKNFAGVYKDRSVIKGHRNILGIGGPETFGCTLNDRSFRGGVRVDVSKSGDITVRDGAPRGSTTPIKYENGKDFRFVNHTIQFSAERQLGGKDYPGFLGSVGKTRWMMNEKQQLVIVSRTGGGGFATVIPVAFWGASVAVFEKR